MNITKSLLIFSLPFLFLACSTPEKKKEWEPEIDQYLRDNLGNITFARTHYPLAKKAEENRKRNKMTRELMEKLCKPGKPKLMHDKFISSDFITLKIDYAVDTKLRVYEFRCAKK